MAENIERYLIEHCSPTLASVKAANLFNAVTEDDQELAEQVKQWNRLMNPKGVKLLVLRNHGRRALVYVYRVEKAAGKAGRIRCCRFSGKVRVYIHRCRVCIEPPCGTVFRAGGISS